MIRAQRSAHRVTFAALGVVLPLLTWRALAARLPAARIDVLPSALEAPSLQTIEHVGDAVESDARAELVRARDGSLALELSLPVGWTAPDALLYWSRDAAADGNLPPDARLCGLARGAGRWRTTPRRELDVERGGFAILFSLAHGVVIDCLRVVASEDAR